VPSAYQGKAEPVPSAFQSQAERRAGRFPDRAGHPRPPAGPYRSTWGVTGRGGER